MGRPRTGISVPEQHLLFIVESVRRADTKEVIIRNLMRMYKIKKKRADAEYQEAIRYINNSIIANVQEYKSMLLDRLEHQYRDTFQIEDISKRVQRQKELVETMAKISGILKTSVAQMNIFEYFPEPIDAEFAVDEKPKELEDNRATVSCTSE